MYPICVLININNFIPTCILIHNVTGCSCAAQENWRHCKNLYNLIIRSTLLLLCVYVCVCVCVCVRERERERERENVL